MPDRCSRGSTSSKSADISPPPRGAQNATFRGPSSARPPGMRDLAGDRFQRKDVRIQGQHELGIGHRRSVQLDHLLPLPRPHLPGPAEPHERGEVLVLDDEANRQLRPLVEVGADLIDLVGSSDDEQLVEQGRREVQQRAEQEVKPRQVLAVVAPAHLHGDETAQRRHYPAAVRRATGDRSPAPGSGGGNDGGRASAAVARSFGRRSRTSGMWRSALMSRRRRNGASNTRWKPQQHARITGMPTTTIRPKVASGETRIGPTTYLLSRPTSGRGRGRCCRRTVPTTARTWKRGRRGGERRRPAYMSAQARDADSEEYVHPEEVGDHPFGALRRPERHEARQRRRRNAAQDAPLGRAVAVAESHGQDAQGEQDEELRRQLILLKGAPIEATPCAMSTTAVVSRTATGKPIRRPSRRSSGNTK